MVTSFFSRFRRTLGEIFNKKGDSVLRYRSRDGKVHYINSNEGPDTLDTSIEEMKAGVELALDSIASSAFTNGVPVLPWEDEQKYGVTLSLTHVTCDNPVVRAKSSGYTATFTSTDYSTYSEYEAAGTMGGEALEDSVFEEEEVKVPGPNDTEITIKRIKATIPEVTGALSITVEAAEPEVPEAPADPVEDGDS